MFLLLQCVREPVFNKIKTPKCQSMRTQRLFPMKRQYKKNQLLPVTWGRFKLFDIHRLWGQDRKRSENCASANIPWGQDEAEETVVTQETYWAGDSVWIYSMSWFLHSRHVRRLLYIQTFVQQIVQNAKSGNIEKECEKRFSQTADQQRATRLFIISLTNKQSWQRISGTFDCSREHACIRHRNIYRQSLEISLFSPMSVVLKRTPLRWKANFLPV